MKLFLATICFLTLGLTSFAQESEWQLYASIDGVEIYTMESDCYPTNIPDQKGILIKVVNNNNETVQVEWDKVLWYNDEIITDNTTDDENHYSVQIEKNSSNEGSCDVPRGAFYIFSDFITFKSETKLTRFELQNIKVTLL